MSRGAQRTTRALTDQQLAQQNQLISQSNQQGQQDRSLMMPTISSLLNSQGYTPQQQSAITQQGLGAANTAFDALRQRAANRVAVTNNSAGYGDLVAQLGREQAQPTRARRSRTKSPSRIKRSRKISPASTRSARPTASTRTCSARRWASPRKSSASASAPPEARPAWGTSGMFGLGSGIASLFG